MSGRVHRVAMTPRELLNWLKSQPLAVGDAIVHRYAGEEPDGTRIYDTSIDWKGAGG